MLTHIGTHLAAQVPSLLDDIKSRLTPERRVRWEELFERLKVWCYILGRGALEFW